MNLLCPKITKPFMKPFNCFDDSQVFFSVDPPNNPNNSRKRENFYAQYKQQLIYIQNSIDQESNNRPRPSYGPNAVSYFQHTPISDMMGGWVFLVKECL